MSRTSYPLGSLGAKVTDLPEEASRLVAQATPVVLVGEDAAALGEAVARAPDRDSQECLLGVMVAVSRLLPARRSVQMKTLRPVIAANGKDQQ